jgi:hypothetical protein
MPKMKSSVKKDWVAALRSNKYLQARQALRVENAYCCLGVLCELYRKENPKTCEWQDSTFVCIETDVEGNQICSNEELTTIVRDWAGLEDTNPILEIRDDTEFTAINANDDERFNFNEIADLIEANL